jgi:hypothetical protein
MPKKQTKRKKDPQGALEASLEGYAIIGRKAMKGYQWAASRIKKEVQQRKVR